MRDGFGEESSGSSGRSSRSLQGESAAAYDEAGQAGEARRRTRLSHGVSPRMSPGMSVSELGESFRRAFDIPALRP